jgi:hypothetical protein
MVEFDDYDAEVEDAFDAGDYGFWSTDERTLQAGECEFCHSRRHTTEEHGDMLAAQRSRT